LSSDLVSMLSRPVTPALQLTHYLTHYLTH
jgi:hypothetical protein